LVAAVGQKTEVLMNIGLQMVANMSIDRYAAWFLALVCGLGWKMDNRRKQKRIASLSEQLKRYEKLMDPNRTSSGLDTAGRAVGDL